MMEYTIEGMSYYIYHALGYRVETTNSLFQQL